ncbi:GAF domain-containing sensor histidine kinase [Anabaena cylindrica FACHB-243]|uniref:histidine kinase n=1 Tax=Anabaena cylindrica (strain ATCC 27899 / PCC 7122) TaxID=272123 RepID=K9ZIZ5_ANACC|nr:MULTISPECIES: GAF domain-containing sensor histidine kinase [Anabaena]AFZ58315.1 GAF sensor signal transduction histidine kinase [Anabaena cylindrica PCC 7122]MBD2416907.1 GAF domain-containing sensor histidine kinase [Anabaena cylindrica FACHB-243]MBY5281918.1 GAF domain-containing sensor histidine kinase [Anabaena sp. CCAP 1446/1C]MBY5310431.1 GAF domain-containing sensor histidine kinase [Anabaena sp. CCAP 1446/1C]MCM2406439.1 GAF domain-containing sensor histidine kinase [Anabaena sp. C
MLSSPDLSFSRTLPLSLFNRLGELLQQMVQSVESTALILTEAVLARFRIPVEWQEQRFTLLISEEFSALLLGNIEDRDEGSKGAEKPSVNLILNASLTFNSEVITSFVSKLRNLLERDSDTYQRLEGYQQIIVPNNVTLQSKFTLLLLDYLVEQQKVEVTKPQNATQHYICQAVEDALTKQIAQERLLNQVTTQIRKSLDLQVIMTTVITQVRDFLELDRLVIYKFEPTKVKNQPTLFNVQDSLSFQSVQEANSQYCQGSVVHETLGKNTISSLLNYQEERCIKQNSQCWEKYRQGFTLAVDDVEKTYVLEECLLKFLKKSQIRAKFVAPIMFEDQLWGLLIAHQCYAPHEWTQSEKKLLTSIAEQLAIAIHQTELMRCLTKEKQTLEQRVIERTMALREALLAAEAASRLRSEFLATISHELLTPLTYVIGMSSTLLRWPLGELSQRQRNYLQTIHDSGEHLLAMIKDILDLSQIEAGKTVLNIAEFSLVKTAQNTLESLQEKATSEKINLKLDLQINPLRDRFTADSSRIEQILWNLLTNAIKFTPEGGSVTLRLWVEENTAIFQVEDTGIGIPEEKLPLLFEKFQQLDTPYRRHYEGTGVGLALTKQIVELHRGRIEVESTVGMGSIFTVWIPVHANAN